MNETDRDSILHNVNTSLSSSHVTSHVMEPHGSVDMS